MVSGQWSVVSGQWSLVSGEKETKVLANRPVQWSVVSEECVEHVLSRYQ